MTPAGPLELDIDAEGRPRLRAGTGDDGLTTAARTRVARAFERGAGHGLLLLGASEPEAKLSPGLAFARDVGAAVVRALVADPRLEEHRGATPPPRTDATLAELAAAAPPIRGAERIDAAHLGTWWDEVAAAFHVELAAHRGTVESWLAARHAGWHVTGELVFHLAENRGDDDHPFAFLCTVATGETGRPRHVPLGRALDAAGAAADKQQLLGLLVPVQRAAERSPVAAGLLASGELYQAVAWTTDEAYRFLGDVPALEAAGVAVRVPDWWQRRRATPRVSVQVGRAKGAELTLDAMVSFDVGVSIDGERITAKELEELLAAGDGLVRLRGRWVALDADRLKELLGRWNDLGDAVTLRDGLRLLSGADVPATDDGLVEVTPGAWLEARLAGLTDPSKARTPLALGGFQGTLRPYQEHGARWLKFATSLGLGVCLADDMGLGKTVQVLAVLAAMKGEPGPPHLLVAPASLLANWQAEAARFVPGLRVRVAHSSATDDVRVEDGHDLAGVDLVLTTYGQVARAAWLRKRAWRLAILDEAQAIRNPGTQQARAVKALEARAKIALTGTPVENQLGDLWSLFDFLAPGLLGSRGEFGSFVKKLADRAKQGGEPPRAGDPRKPPQPWAPLRRLVAPYLLRRVKSDPTVAPDLPAKTEVDVVCGLSRRQAALYQRVVTELTRALAEKDGIARKGLVLSSLMKLKQICNHPDHFLGEGGFREEDSGKLVRLRAIVDELASRQERVLVFTQFREMTGPLERFLADAFGRPGLVLHGGTPIAQRAKLVARFQADDAAPFFVLSLKAGGVGLNLTGASHVVHFDRWWNPAVENQATDRAFRIGQHKNVLVHRFVCRGTVEEKIAAMLEGKRALAHGVIEGGGEQALTELDDAALRQMVTLDLARATAEL